MEKFFTATSMKNKILHQMKKRRNKANKLAEKKKIKKFYKNACNREKGMIQYKQIKKTGRRTQRRK